MSEELQQFTVEESNNNYENWLSSTSQQVQLGQLTESKRDSDIARLLQYKDQLTSKYRRETYIDPLTKIPNRRAFDETYQTLIDSGKPFGMILIDVDDLKKCNDTYGHSATDNMLAQLALTLQTTIRISEKRDKDMIARIGGDEFAAIFPELDSNEDLAHIANKLIIAAKRPIIVNSNNQPTSISPSVSIGGGLYDRSGPTAFFERVDLQGLYPAKKSGKGKVVIVS